MDPSEPNWQTNSSFSPPLSRRLECQFQSDGLSRESCRVHLPGSSLSSRSRGSRSRLSSDQYANHHHSISDGALSYFGSPDNFQPPRWTPPVQRFDLGEFSTPAGGARPETSLFPRSTERCFPAEASSISNSIESASPLSESGRLGSTSKQPILFPPRNFSGRRSFMSKPVYPLAFRNPISDGEACGLAEMSGGSRFPPIESKRSPTWRGSILSPELKFHKALSELQKMEASPEPNMSSRREGFRWSNASSYDFGFEGESIDMSEQGSLENMRSPNNNNSSVDQKCGLCGRLLWQKSPWGSHRIVRNSDMPIAGVLPCSHVFHAECLEETTPKTQINDPPCPLCLKAVNGEGSISFSEPLQVALRSARRNQGASVAVSYDVGTSGDPSVLNKVGDLKRNCSLPVLRRGGSSLIKKHFKKHFTFKGKMGKDLLGAKMLGRAFSSPSSSSSLNANKKQEGCLRSGQS